MSVFSKKIRNRRTGEYQRSKTWYISYRAQDGRRIQERTPYGRREKWRAKQLLAQRKQATKSSTPSPSAPTPNVIQPAQGPLLERLIEDFLAYKELRCRPTTHAFYRFRLRSFRIWGERQAPPIVAAGQLDATVLESFIRDQKGAVADATLNHSIKAVKNLTRWAVNHGLLQGPEPLSSVTSIRVTPRRPRRMPLTTCQFSELIAATPPWRRIWWQFLVLSGLRSNEARRLRLDDYRDGAVHVRAEIAKSGEPRLVPLPAELNRLLQAWIAQDRRSRKNRMTQAIGLLRVKLEQATTTTKADRLAALLERCHAELDHDYLLTNRDGFPIRNNFLRSIKSDARRAGLRALDIHTLRYTYDAWSLALGINAKTVQARMGHKRPELTVNHYAPSAFFTGREGLDSLAEQAGLTATDAAKPQTVPASPCPMEKLPITREVLLDLTPMYSDRTIARVLGVSGRAIGKARERFGIARDRRVANAASESDIQRIRGRVRQLLAKSEVG